MTIFDGISPDQLKQMQQPQASKVDRKKAEAKKEGAKSAAGGATGDKVKVSDRAKDMLGLKGLIADLPEVRQEKVDALKREIEQGTYQINAEGIAGKMIDEIV